ncbi:hypothetical protein JCM3766R1_004129 [Sporobolomyces carnicolor]
MATEPAFTYELSDRTPFMGRLERHQLFKFAPADFPFRCEIFPNVNHWFCPRDGYVTIGTILLIIHARDELGAQAKLVRAFYDVTGTVSFEGKSSEFRHRFDVSNAGPAMLAVRGPNNSVDTLLWHMKSDLMTFPDTMAPLMMKIKLKFTPRTIAVARTLGLVRDDPDEKPVVEHGSQDLLGEATSKAGNKGGEEGKEGAEQGKKDGKEGEGDRDDEHVKRAAAVSPEADVKPSKKRRLGESETKRFAKR